jgi:hypothetical protein
VSLADAVNDMAHAEPSRVPLAQLDFEKQTGTVIKAAPVASEDYRRVVEEATGYKVPEGQDVVLERMTLHQGPTGVQYWYKFKFVARTEELADIERPSLAELRRWVKSQTRKADSRKGRGRPAVLNIADLQIGKTDRWGGTKETVEQFMVAVEEMRKYIIRNGCPSAVLTELGDGAENFQNTPSQAQTNDRQLIEQLDLHTELLAHATVTLAREVDDLTVLGVPSNHMEVRENGHAVGGPHNDYGLLSMSNVKRIVQYNPDAFGHVKFVWPTDHEVSVTIPVNGTSVGFAHGHYSRGSGAADGVPKWLTGQFAGNHPLQPADIIVTAHFHHLRMQNIIGGRWWLQAPTLDRGSSWLERSNGEGNSQNGILAFTVADGTWHDLELLRTA